MDDDIEILVQTEDEEWLPFYASTGAAGADVKAAISEPLTLLPQETLLVPTGIKVEIPQGYEIQVRPRSGLALKYGITVLNTPGTIDSDYRGPVQVILINHGKAPFVITPGMRIAQLVIQRAIQAKFVFSDSLQITARGAAGFGHTGLH